MALSNTDLHWIPMNRSKFDQLRRMFDSEEKDSMRDTLPCEKCTSPRIRYTPTNNTNTLSQIRALLRPVELRDSSGSSRSPTISEASFELRSRNLSALSNHNDTPSSCSPSSDTVPDLVGIVKTNGVTTADSLPEGRSTCDNRRDVIEPECNGSAEILTCRETDPLIVVSSPPSPSDKHPSTPLVNNHNVAHGNLNEEPCIRSVTADSDGQAVIHENGTISHESVVLANGVASPSSSHKESSGPPDEEGDTSVKVSVEENGNISDESFEIDAEIHGNNVFLNMVNGEAEVLTKEREYFLSVIDDASAVSEDAGGRVMAACGKANLLLTSKFKQYRGLCYDYEKTNRKMTADDMQGFWELIMLQVDDVKSMFAKLRELERSKWIITRSPMPRKRTDSEKASGTTPLSTKKKAPKGKTAAQKARDEARRKMLAAKKEEMRQKMKNKGSDSPEILIV